MKQWRFAVTLALLVISGGLLLTDFLLFRRGDDIVFYTVHSLALIPLNVLIVTFVIDKLLEARAKREKLKKMNMVIGAFFSEAGNELLMQFLAIDKSADLLRGKLAVNSDWSSRRFLDMRREVNAFDFSVAAPAGSLTLLKERLTEKRLFLLGLLENPNLLEHDTFTDLLWAVFHLTEELHYRKSLETLSVNDRQHLENDIKRAYARLAEEWLFYMCHLKEDYPYLFSLAVRLSPFNPQAKAEIA